MKAGRCSTNGPFSLAPNRLRKVHMSSDRLKMKVIISAGS
jgi:hypothetical protein